MQAFTHQRMCVRVFDDLSFDEGLLSVCGSLLEYELLQRGRVFTTVRVTSPCLVSVITQDTGEQPTYQSSKWWRQDETQPHTSRDPSHYTHQL